jgi:hypothetical protein
MRSALLPPLPWKLSPCRWPEAGDLEQGHTLPAYCELARVLEPRLYLGRYFHDAELRRWEHRFLD